MPAVIMSRPDLTEACIPAGQGLGRGCCRTGFAGDGEESDPRWDLPESSS